MADRYEQAAREIERLRADLAEAVALLRRVHSWGFGAECPDPSVENNRLWRRRDALLARHKSEPAKVERAPAEEDGA